MQCAKPRFINITVQIAKELRNVKFVCNNSDLGCPKILNYEEVPGHADQCKYLPVKCQAYNKCKTKCIRMEIEKHQAVCPNLQVPCIYCRNYVERMNIIAHEQEECTGTYTCGKCGMVIIKEETQKNTHNCFNALAGYL